MQKSFVIIGAYNSLAEGADPSLFEETYQVSWRPFLSTLYRFPDLPAVLHYSGTVLTWLEAKHPEFLMLLEEMVSRKQIELLGGGFFAPLIPLLPGQDRLGQIEMLTTYIRRGFGRRPRGCWLQDYCWEAGLASALRPAVSISHSFPKASSARPALTALSPCSPKIRAEASQYSRFSMQSIHSPSSLRLMKPSTASGANIPPILSSRSSILARRAPSSGPAPVLSPRIFSTNAPSRPYRRMQPSRRPRPPALSER